MIHVNRPNEPAYAGMGTFCKVPLALTPEDLAGADVAIVGAPFDEGTTNRSGTRFGPRAIRQAENYPLAPPSRPHMHLGIDAFSQLRVVDYGDAECMPANLEGSHRAIEERVGEILAAPAIPVVLGGDHSVALPDMTAVGRHFGSGHCGVIHFDTHADTGDVLWGTPNNHGTPMRRVVENGSIRGEHFLQFGLRGYFPDPPDFEWMRSVGMRWHTMYEIDERGFRTVLDDLLDEARTLPDAIFLSVDVDALDPAFAPGTGTPEPGGLTPRELLHAVRKICLELRIVGMEIVEVSPPYDPSGITALFAQRCVVEALSAIALRRSGRAARPEFPAMATYAVATAPYHQDQGDEDDQPGS